MLFRSKDVLFIGKFSEKQSIIYQIGVRAAEVSKNTVGRFPKLRGVLFHDILKYSSRHFQVEMMLMALS